MPEFKQMPGCDFTADRVVDFDQIAVRNACDFAVKEYERHFYIAQRGPHHGVAARGDKYQAINTFLSQYAKIGSLSFGVVIGVAQDDVVSGRKTAVFDAANDFGKVGIRVVGNHHAERSRAVVLKASCHGARDVAQLAYRLLDPKAGCFADEASAIDHV